MSPANRESRAVSHKPPLPVSLGKAQGPGRKQERWACRRPGPAEGRPRMEVPTFAETGEYHVVTPATF